MLISVIVPVYNTKEYLSQCLDSVLDQSHREIEVLLIDDGSTDGSAEMCDAYAGKDDRVRVWHREHSGVSAGRNFALQQAQGEWISFVDSDDWLDPDMYRELMNLYKKTGADTLCCDFWQCYGDRKVLSGRWDIFKEAEHFSNKEDALGEILGKSCTLWNKLLIADIAKQVSFDRTMRYGEDTVYIAEYLEEAGSAAFTKEALYYYREIRDGNVVSAELNERHLDLLKATVFLVRVLKEHSENLAAARRSVLAIEQVLHLIPLKNVRRFKEYISAAKDISLMIKPVEKEAYRNEHGLYQYERRMMLWLPRRFKYPAVIYAKWLYNRDLKKQLGEKK